MGRMIAIYVTIFVVVFTLISVGLYFVFVKNSGEEPQTVEAVSDSIDTSAAQARVDSIMSAAPDTLAHLRPDSLEVTSGNLPDPMAEYNNLMTLRRHLIEFYTHGEIRAYSNAEIDSIFTGFVNQIDSLAVKQQRYISSINMLNRSFNSSETTNADLVARIDSLEEKISTMEEEHAEEVKLLTSGDRADRLRSASSMWENMKPQNAAQSLLPLTDEEVLTVLRNMNVRRASKILDEMPEMRAASLLRSLSQP